MARNTNSEKVMPLIGHLMELRNRILVSLVTFLLFTIAAFIFSEKIISLFTSPFDSVASVIGSKLVVTTLIEGFSAQVQVAVYTGLICSMPVHVLNILGFIFPGIGRRGKRIILAFLLSSLVLIVFGAYLAYYRVVPLAIAFLTNPYFVPEGVGYLLSYQANIFYVFMFIIWCVVALQLPLVMEILLVLNVLNRKAVWKAARFIIVGIFILSAIVTPPDFISQLGVALPLIALFFIALLVAKIFKFGEA